MELLLIAGTWDLMSSRWLRGRRRQCLVFCCDADSGNGNGDVGDGNSIGYIVGMVNGGFGR